jgi:nuclear pore complex protein Nup160
LLTHIAHPDPKIATDRHSSGLLDDTEWNLLYAGLPRYYYHIVSLFDKDKLYSFVVDFARIALQFAAAGSKDNYVLDLRTELHSRLFNAALQTSRYEIAYSALTLFTNQALQLSSLRALIYRMCETSSASELIDLPFVGLQSAVDDILAQKCQSILDVNSSVPYHKILYAWRIKRNDFRGAAAVSLERLQKLQQSGDGDKSLGVGPGTDGLETPVTKQYLMLINALSCVDPKQAWILSEPLSSKAGPGGGGSAGPVKRKVITLDDARKGYQEELDRIAAIENNQFAFESGDEMDLA